MKLDQYISDLIEREGGYSFDPNDAGGETMYGITFQVARAYGYHGFMKDMPKSVAHQIYETRYWFNIGLDKVNDYAPMVAEEMLDTGVNMGTSWPGRFLQRALNVLNKQGKSYPDIYVDGNVGPMTIAALRAYLAARGKDGLVVLLRMLNAQQSVRYIEIAEGKPTQEDFVFGWQLNRTAM